MEGRTSVVYMHLDDLGIGVKSHSNLAIAGSCRNMPRYSLLPLVYGVKLQIKFAESPDYGTFSNSEPLDCKGNGDSEGV